MSHNMVNILIHTIFAIQKWIFYIQEGYIMYYRLEVKNQKVHFGN